MVILFISFVLAQNYPLSITEIMYDLPGKDDNYEWIEVKNVSSQNLFLKSGKSGWRLFDGSNHLFKNDLEINVGEIFIIGQNFSAFKQRYPNFRGKFVEANFSLKNSGGVIKIISEKGEIMAEASYNNSNGGNGNGYSLVWVNGKYIESKIENGTPGYEEQISEQKNLENISTSSNSSEINFNQPQNNTSTLNLINPEKYSAIKNATTTDETSLDLLSNLYLNEIFPNPETSETKNEFIEIYNRSNERIDLTNIVLEVDDKEFPLSGYIEGGDYKVLYRDDYKFILKNSGSKIALKDKNGNYIHSLKYSNSYPGLSLSRFVNDWKWTKPTPGSKNILVENINNNAPEKFVNKNIPQNYENKDIFLSKITSEKSNSTKNILLVIISFIVVIMISIYIIFKVLL